MPRILFVAALHSPLAARWIHQLSDTEWDVHVFGEGDKIHPLFEAQNITVHKSKPPSQPQNVKGHIGHVFHLMAKALRRVSRHVPLLAELMPEPLQHQLTELIRKLEPDILHSLKMQNEGYTSYRALKSIKSELRPLWVYSAWGSDIYVFQNFAEHRRKLRRALAEVDFLMVDNKRDIALAQKHGFKGTVLGVFPTGGGYSIQHLRRSLTQPPSRRRIIAVKGYQAQFGGQVLTALRAIDLCGEKFTGYQIVIHSAIGTYASTEFEHVKSFADQVADRCKVPISFLPFSPVDTIWDLFCQSRIALAISNSDGTPNAMLEAMVVGAFPIQSDTGGLDQWITSGQNGYLVSFTDVNAIAEAIVSALEDDRLVDSAASINISLTERLLDYNVVQKNVLDAYDAVFPREMS